MGDLPEGIQAHRRPPTGPRPDAKDLNSPDHGWRWSSWIFRTRREANASRRAAARGRSREIWSQSFTVALRRLNRASLISNILLCVVVVCLVAWIVSEVMDREPALWAEITEYHAAWDPEAGVVIQSLKIVKHQQCDDVKLSKTMNLIGEDGNVVGDIIRLNGNLKPQILRIEPGPKPAHVFGRATPKTANPLSPGEYLVTLTAVCEQEQNLPTGPVALRALPVVATIMVTAPNGGGR